MTWTAGKHVSFVTLNQSVAEATVGAPVTVSASVADASAGPPVPIAGITLTFNVGGQTCNGVTNANGVASCSVSVPLIGAYTLTVTFAGNGQFNPSSDGRAFHVTAAPTPPCFAFNDVDVTSGFCPNVEWMRNRAVTLGCTTTLYCPVDYVTRLQMAAFMNRLGTTLSGETRFVGGQPGALALDEIGRAHV